MSDATNPDDAISHEAGVAIRVKYTNWRGETAERRILPVRRFRGATEFHPEEQELLDAIDLDRGVMRTFAVKDMEILGRA